MKILVTGALGFIGSHFVELALENYHTVLITDGYKYSARLKNLPVAAEQLNICDAVGVRQALESFQPDAVINFAAETHVTRSIEDHDEFLRTNVFGLATLLEECQAYWVAMGRRPSFRVVNVSTDEVYGSLAPREEPWTEASPYQPNNLYAASKAAGDHLARAFFHTHGLPVITTHSSNNYGTRQHPEKLIPALIARLLANKPMILHGDGLHSRDWLNVQDNVRGILHAAMIGKPGETYNFGGRCERTNYDIAVAVWQALARIDPTTVETTSHIDYAPDRAGNDRRYALNNHKAITQLGWMPCWQIEDALPEIVQWYINNPNYGSEYEG